MTEQSTWNSNSIVLVFKFQPYWIPYGPQAPAMCWLLSPLSYPFPSPSSQTHISKNPRNSNFISQYQAQSFNTPQQPHMHLSISKATKIVSSNKSSWGHHLLLDLLFDFPFSLQPCFSAPFLTRHPAMMPLCNDQSPVNLYAYSQNQSRKFPSSTEIWNSPSELCPPQPLPKIALEVIFPDHLTLTDAKCFT